MTRRFALIGVAAAALAGTAAIQAQPTRPAHGQERPRMEQRGPGVRHGGPGMALRGLNLTDEQKAQVKAIHERARTEVEGVLTPEQLATLKTRRAGRGGGRGGR